jgi:MtaA/CmuA family methyltransferase
MTRDQWKIFKTAALSGETGKKGGVPVALIIDSPWIPGFKGISHTDYFTMPDVWLKANLEVEERFPDMTFLPGFWVEYGMAAEPSAFGVKVAWDENRTPSVHPMIADAAEISRLQVPNPLTDGLMPFVLNYYKHAEKALSAKGRHIGMVAGRGPLAIAGHLRGVTELMMDIKLNPEPAKQLLDITTQTVIAWLKAQAAALPAVEGILVLDDIVGFLSPDDYMEFAHPYLKKIFSAFPDMVKVYHNDARTDHILEGLADTGFHVFNFSHNHDIGEVKKRIGDKVRLLGNVPPRHVLVNGTPEEVTACARACIEKTGGKGLILSAGGGASMDTPAANLDALIAAARQAK